MSVLAVGGNDGVADTQRLQFSVSEFSVFVSLGRKPCRRLAVAIVVIGRIVERPWVVDGRIEPRSVITVSVSADHRAVDGRGAGSFLTAFDRALQAPEKL